MPKDTMFYSYNVGSSKVIGARSFNITLHKLPASEDSSIDCALPPGGNSFVPSLMDETAGRIILYDRNKTVVSILDYTSN